MKEKKKEKAQVKKEHKETHKINIFVVIVVAIITISFIFAGGYSKNPLKGFKEFISEIGKEKIENEDGSISIPSEAQVLQNQERSEGSDLYVGKVLGEKIQLFKDDEFNYTIGRILNYKELNPIQKYQFARDAFDREINKIIGMHNARKMDIIISKDYLIKRVGERHFRDDDGDINYEAMKKNPKRVNDAIEKMMDDLLFENFKRDYFQGLPVSYDEIYDEYKLDNVKVTLKYIDISNNEVGNEKLESYYYNNREDYKQYKLIRLVFRNKEDAEFNLESLRSDPKKFVEIGNQLKIEDKIINIVYDSEYSFLDGFESQELSDAVKAATQNEVSDKIVETELGFVVFLLDKIQYASFDESSTYERVKKDYLKKNIDIIEKKNEELANQIYAYSLEKGIDSAAGRFKVEAKSTPQAEFLGYNIPNVNPDETDDLNYMIKFFKGKKGDTLAPYRYGNGFMISEILDKTEVSKEVFENLYDDLYERYSERKSQNIEMDYYKGERERMKVVDNFRYVFNYQMFIPSEKEEQ